MLNDDEQKTFSDAIKLLKQTTSETQIRQLGLYIEELMKWNSVYNLTGFRTFQDNLINNLLDCLSIAPFVKGNRLVDVGTGAGLPGCLLAIVNPEQNWTLLDANGKKIRFLQQIKQKLVLDNVMIVNGRVEEYQPLELYEVMCSRAFDKIPETLNKSQHLLKSKSKFFAMKGRLLKEDLEALPEWAGVETIIKVEVPMLNGERHLIQIDINKNQEV